MLPRLASCLVVLLLLMPVTAFAAGCEPNVARKSPLLVPVKWTLAGLKNASVEEGGVGLTFIGHATVLIESPQGVTAATDLTDFFPPPVVPDIATMNHFHDTHYTNHPDPGIKYVLRGWDIGEGAAHWDVTLKDMRVRNVPTNVRNWFNGSTEFNGNSIFIFEAAGLCIAHLSHLQHTLTPEHLAALGQIDVLLPMVDGAYSLSQNDIIDVIDQIKPQLIIPIHYFGPGQLDRFLARMHDRFPIERRDDPHVVRSRMTLPAKTEIMILPSVQPESFRFAPPTRN